MNDLMLFDLMQFPNRNPENIQLLKVHLLKYCTTLSYVYYFILLPQYISEGYRSIDLTAKVYICFRYVEGFYIQNI